MRGLHFACALLETDPATHGHDAVLVHAIVNRPIPDGEPRLYRFTIKDNRVETNGVYIAADGRVTRRIL